MKHVVSNLSLMLYGGFVNPFLQALAEQSRIVRLPLNKIGSINKINKTYAFLEQAHERPPSAEEIAKELDMTINDVKESMKNSGRHVSMDAPLVEGEDSNLYDVLRSGESPNPDQRFITRIFEN